MSRGQKRNLRNRILLNLDRETQSFDLPAKFMVKHHLPESSLTGFKSPVHENARSLLVPLNPHCPNLLPIEEKPSTLYPRGGLPSQGDCRSPKSRDSLFKRALFRGLTGIFREFNPNTHFFDPGQHCNPHVIPITLGLPCLSKIMKALLGGRKAVLEPTDAIFQSCPLEGFCQGILSLTLHHQRKLLHVVIRISDDNPYLIAFEHVDVLRLNRKSHRTGITEITERSDRTHEKSLGLSGENNKDGTEHRRECSCRPEPALRTASPHLAGRIDSTDVSLSFLDELLQKLLGDAAPSIIRKLQSSTDTLLNFRVTGLQPPRNLDQGNPSSERLDQPLQGRPKKPQPDQTKEKPADLDRKGSKNEVSRHRHQKPTQHHGRHGRHSTKDLHSADPLQKGLEGLGNFPG